MEYTQRLDCLCATLPNLAIIDMEPNMPVLRTLKEIAERGSPYWWLSLYRCKSCGCNWLVGQEERQNDILILQRLTRQEAELVMNKGEWPKAFDKYATLLQIGRDANKRVRFDDPMNSSLVYTIIDLALESPGIHLSEIAELLNLDIAIAHALSRKAVLMKTVWINMSE